MYDDKSKILDIFRELDVGSENGVHAARVFKKAQQQGMEKETIAKNIIALMDELKIMKNGYYNHFRVIPSCEEFDRHTMAQLLSCA